MILSFLGFMFDVFGCMIRFFLGFMFDVVLD